MNSEDYLKEGLRQLNDTNYYQKLNKDPTEDHEKLINNTIDDLVSENAINEETASLLRPNKSRTPKFYMLRKLHKKACQDALWFHLYPAQPKKFPHL